MKYKIVLTFLLVQLFSAANAQPFSLKSTGAGKIFHLNIYYGTQGKGAFVQYLGQKGIIALKLQSHKKTVVQGKPMQSRVTYIWNELLEGKINGSYGIVEQSGSVLKAWYTRKRDGKYFHLVTAMNAQTDTAANKYFLHGTLITFSPHSGDLLSFHYPNGTTKTHHLPDFDHPDPQRKATIADYNFDGYDDVAFSIPDAGMGVYRTFSIYLYHPGLKQFKELVEPNDPRANCSGFCDVTLNQQKKLLMTSCRGAATWWTDAYRFASGNKLVWVPSVQ